MLLVMWQNQEGHPGSLDPWMCFSSDLGSILGPSRTGEQCLLGLTQQFPEGAWKEKYFGRAVGRATQFVGLGWVEQ